MSFCKITKVQQLRSYILPLRRPNPLMGLKKQTRNIRWVGSQTFLVIYCCIYTLRNVGQESSRLLSRSDHMVNIFRLRAVFRWKDSEHAPVTGKVTSFPGFPGGIQSLWVILVLH